MESFKIALVQQRSPVGKKDRNMRAAISWIRRAASEGSSLVCFPELNLSGHAGHPSMLNEAETVPGPAVETLSRVGADFGIYICAGIAEVDRGIHFNTQFLVGPEGYVGKQRKTHLSLDEYFYFRPGTLLNVFDLPFARVGMVVCYDNLLPEVSRCMAVRGAELLLCPHAARFGRWPPDEEARRKAVKSNKEMWQIVHSCRAYDNGCYSALCNAVGRSAVGIKGVEANHAGGCMVFDPHGHLASESESADIAEEMLVVPLDGRLVHQRRGAACFNLQTRRPDVFRTLIEHSD